MQIFPQPRKAIAEKAGMFSHVMCAAVDIKVPCDKQRDQVCCVVEESKGLIATIRSMH